MTQINVYLTFGGNCREAMTFYKECLGGELTLQTVGDSPMAGQMPPEAQKSVLHSTLVKGDLALLASDMMGPEGPIIGNTISLSLACNSEEEIKMFFANLSAGGQVTHSLSTEFWGGTFGMLTDKFGMNWFLNYEESSKA